ncbi:MAG: ThiF family adenylyltransferase [Candidatus Bipolaricaulota bacterium]|nr:ThiF family adenylyltransferase [Candidatus Bipolaricaulota bacterium]
MVELTPSEIERYARQLLLIGPKGQRALRRKSVLIVGLGGLGTPAALYLAAAGVGRLGLLDDGRVELSNLQRQIIYQTSDVGRSKVEVVAEKLSALNPSIELTRHSVRLSAQNALEILRAYDLILDGSDNFPTRYLVNDVSVLLKKPNVHGSVLGWEGQVTVFLPEGPCYRCLYPKPPAPGAVPDCAAAGVMGTTAGLVGLIQANEALKILLEIPSQLRGRLLLVDTRNLSFTEIVLRRDPQCALCGERATIRELRDYENFCA